MVWPSFLFSMQGPAHQILIFGLIEWSRCIRHVYTFFKRRFWRNWYGANICEEFDVWLTECRIQYIGTQCIGERGQSRFELDTVGIFVECRSMEEVSSSPLVLINIKKNRKCTQVWLTAFCCISCQHREIKEQSPIVKGKYCPVEVRE